MSAGIHSEFSRQLVTGCKGTILRLLNCSHVAGLSLGAPSFYVAQNKGAYTELV